MTRAVSKNSYKGYQKAAREDAARLRERRTVSLGVVRENRNRIAREDAIGAYIDARYWAHESARRLADVHPEHAPDMSPRARARWDAMNANR